MNRDFWAMMVANGYRLKNDPSGFVCITAPTGGVVVQGRTADDAIQALEKWFRAGMGIAK